MSPLHRTLLAACAALSFALASTPALAAGPDDALFDEANAALKASDYPLAYQRFSELFKRKQSLDIAANLSLAESKIGKLRDAAEHLAFALSVLPETSPAGLRERMEADLGALEAKVGRLSFQCPDGTTISVNGTPVGVTPLKTVYVDPGEVTITAQHPQKGRGTAKVKVAAGENVTSLITLKPDETAEGGKPLWPTLLLAGLGAAGLGGGVGLTVVALNTKSAAIDDAQACSPWSSDCQAQGNDDLSAANGLLGGGIALLGVGAACLAGIGVYYAIPAGDDGAKAAVLTPMFTPGGAGLSLSTSF